MILDDYIAYQNTYSQKYGDKTIVVIQVGDFFELYAYYGTDSSSQLEEGSMIGPDLPRICDICNLQLTRKNKSIIEATSKNPMMAGFPLYILSKHVQTLTSAGYTVVVVRQVTPPPNPKRDVTDVFSPATQLNTAQREGAFLMVMCWEQYGQNAAIGMAAVDVTSGETVVYETASRPDNINEAEDEAIRWLHAFSPKELVVLGEAPRESLSIYENCGALVHAGWQCAAANKIAYQNELFARAFDMGANNAGLLSPIEALTLCPYELARTALAALLQFVHEHNETLVSQLSPPRFLSPKGHLHLAHNSAQQLNIIGTGNAGERPLHALLNRCSTAFGARAFKDRLLHPITDADELEKRYDAIQRHMEAPPEALAATRRHLSGVQDLERMARRLSVRRFAPMEWPALVQSLEAAAAALGGIGVPLVDDIVRIFDIGECAKYTSADIRSNIFREGVFPEVDAAAAAFAKSVGFFDEMAEAFGGEGAIRVDSNERDGYFLTTTKRRWEAVCKSFSGPLDLTISCSSITLKPISASSTTVRLVHPLFKEKSACAVADMAQLRAAACEAYKTWMESNGVAYARELRTWIAPVAEIDIALTNAKNALDFAYCRPALHTSGEPLTLTQLRHPMIERFLTHMAYVPNDLTLGGLSTGMLLYGMNAAGKSSLMKAAGLAVVMAQAGMYVPAASMTFTPFEQLFTRISGADNIYRGMSTFVVEMTELRNILQRANGPSCLVLGDELCAGTEALSAVSIVSAGVNELLRRRCPFIFATHLHELAGLIDAGAGGSVRVCHMHVEVGGEGGTGCGGGLVYDRTLREGIGHKTYGIEVCRGLGMPERFLREADATRRTLQGVPEDLVSPKTSSYNAAVFVDCCGVCGERATEVHHIKYQKDAIAKLHAHVPQNHASNLVSLCEECHKKEHAGALHIVGWVQTSEGRLLKVNWPERIERLERPDELATRLRFENGQWSVRPHLGRPWTAGVSFDAVVTLARKHFPSVVVESIRQLESKE